MQRRLRALPSRARVYFVLALAMFPRLGYVRVWASSEQEFFARLQQAGVLIRKAILVHFRHWPEVRWPV